MLLLADSPRDRTSSTPATDMSADDLGNRVLLPRFSGRIFAVIGAQKSASTSVARLLASHPDVYVPRIEETAFEDEYYSHESLDEFERRFRRARRSLAAVGFKHPNLFHRASCAGRLNQNLPDVRVVLALREPVSRTVSAWYLYVRLGLVPLVDVESGLRACLSGEFATRYPASEQILTYSRYAESLDRYQRLFGERMLVILAGDLRAKPDEIHTALAHFVGVDPTTLPSQVRRPNAGIFSTRRLAMHRFANRLLFDGPGAYPRLRGGRWGRTVFRGVALAEQIMPRRPATVPQLSGELIDALGAHFADDIDETERLLGRSLAAWRNPRLAGPRESG